MINNNTAFEKNINLYRLIWQSVFIQVLFLIIFLFIDSYFHFKNMSTKLTNEVKSEIVKQEQYFSSEIYLEQEKAIEMRFQQIINNILRLYPNVSICLKLISEKSSSQHRKILCNDTTIERKPLKNLAASPIPIRIGDTLLAKIQYAVFLPFKPIQSLPANLLLLIIASTMCVLIVQFFWVRNFKRTVVEPMLETIRANTRAIALADIASQVAHDIRSPLTALDIVMEDANWLPEDQRILIRNAVTRIHDIANNLITAYKSIIVNEQNTRTRDIEFVTDILSSVLSEKRVQYKNTAITFVTDFGVDAYSLFSYVQAVDLKRVFSNLINNAVESIKDKGFITLNLMKKKDFLSLKIIDTGHGIPLNILKKIQHEKISFGKKNGVGLGLYNSIKLIETWGGNLSIQSEIGNGTTVEVILPALDPPDWFACNLSITHSTIVVILDDDESIHGVWNKRFGSNIELLEFYNPTDLIHWYRKAQPINVLFLIDYELLEASMNGLQVIEHLGISKYTRLVTSRYEEEEIRQQCEQLDLKIIPKSFAVHIPIHILPSNPDVIFIDDDVDLTNAWIQKGKEVGKCLLTFNNSNDFKSMMSYYSYDIPIYIDYDLQENITGQEFAKFLYAKGYHNLYLATGHEKSYFSYMDYVKEIVGKKPPF